MPSLLPLQKPPVLRCAQALAGSLEPARYDAILLLLPTAAKLPASLPEAGRWQILHARRKPSHGDVRIATLDNPRMTLAVLGYCRPEADGFERLRIAGLMAQKAFAGRDPLQRTAVLAPGFPGDDGPWVEALYAALAAHAFALPTAKKQTVVRKPLERVDAFGAGKLDARRAECIAGATNLARHLTALPPNVLDAPAYRRLLGTLARRHGLTLRWNGEAALRRLGANAFLAVSRGNQRRDAGIAHLAYRPRGRSRARAADLALVGKGILFDTGGTNLKPHRAMLDMHTDMAGSAVAVATLVAAAQLRLPLALDAWLAITENSIGPKAYRPQEVIRAANGTTIQIIHTDAEGRMALADTLALAARAKPRAIVDFATLTGACVYALTERMSGLLCTDETLAARLLAAGATSGERLWRFPMPEDFDADIESHTADIAQCAVEGKGDHIHAARFLKHFVPDSIPWAHIDLSSATRRGGLAHVPTEITGFGARLALTWLLDHRKKA